MTTANGDYKHLSERFNLVDKYITTAQRADVFQNSWRLCQKIQACNRFLLTCDVNSDRMAFSYGNETLTVFQWKYAPMVGHHPQHCCFSVVFSAVTPRRMPGFVAGILGSLHAIRVKISSTFSPVKAEVVKYIIPFSSAKSSAFCKSNVGLRSHLLPTKTNIIPGPFTERASFNHDWTS